MALHYDFPVIHNISDVLPHIDTKNFRVVEKDELTFINYAKMGTDPFPDILPGNTAEANLSAAVRRECRGIAFYTDGGEIASRPFQKFFNAGERADMPLADIQISRPHYNLNKLDGSRLLPSSASSGTPRRSSSSARGTIRSCWITRLRGSFSLPCASTTLVAT
jgi:hypothetical protein